MTYEEALERQWQEGYKSGHQKALEVTVPLVNWLWENGRGDEACRIGRDEELFEKLMEEYRSQVG